MKYVDTWDLEAIFPGGTQSPELQAKLKEVTGQIEELKALIHNWNFTENNSAEPFKAILKQKEIIGKGLGQAGTFVHMWQDAYTNDEHANVVIGQVYELYSEVEKLSTTFNKKIVAITDEEWNTLLQDATLQEVSFALNEIRDEGKRLLSEDRGKNYYRVK